MQHPFCLNCLKWYLRQLKSTNLIPVNKLILCRKAVLYQFWSCSRNGVMNDNIIHNANLWPFVVHNRLKRSQFGIVNDKTALLISQTLTCWICHSKSLDGSEEVCYLHMITPHRGVKLLFWDNLSNSQINVVFVFQVIFVLTREHYANGSVPNSKLYR